MGFAVEVVGGAVTESAVTTFVAVTPGAGDSFTVRPSEAAGKAYLETMIRNGAHVGKLRVRSPALHDNTQGIRVATPATAPNNALPPDLQQVLSSQDALVLESTGTAADVDTAAIGIYYTDVGGMAARLVNPGDIAARVVNIVGIEVAAVASATVGTWGDVLITATEDVMHANTDYALLGYLTDVAQTAIAVKSADTGNLRLGGPGAIDPKSTRRYFVEMSLLTGRPHICLLNSGNKAQTYVSVLSSTASNASEVTLILAELAA